MNEHVERMKVEHNELNIKATALEEFIFTNDIFPTLDMKQQVFMSQQLGFMKSYQNILHLRIYTAPK
jgi:hypothetical protein